MENVRHQKAQKLRENGKNPYAASFDRSHTLDDARNQRDGTHMSVAGRIVLLRDMGKITFVTLQDQSGRLQIALRTEEVGEASYKEFLEVMDLGDFIGVEGERFTTQKGEPTVAVKKWTMLTKALRQPPEKWHGVQDRETIYRHRYLDTMSNRESMHRFLFRSAFIRAMREFYWEHGFVEVDLPVLVNEASGALATPFTTHHEALDLDVYLRIALETHQKECLVGGFDRTFSIGPVFRNEGMDPSHLQEFTMCEHYAAYWDFTKNMVFTEKMLRTLLQEVCGTTTLRIADRNGALHDVDFGKPWETVSLRELILRDCGIDYDECSTADALRAAIAAKGIALDVDVSKLGRGNLIDQLYKKVSRPSIVGPMFVTNHPIDLSPLARKNDENPGITDRFQLVVSGWEIVNAYSELVDPVDQAERFAQQAKAKTGGDTEAHGKDDAFVEALEYGCPPCSGWGMGIDRLVTLLTNQENLRDVVLFPIMKPDQKKLTSKEAEERYRSKKCVVIADETLNAGIVANAIGQLGITIGGHTKESLFDSKILHDADKRIHYTDSLYPMTNLAGSQKDMATFAEHCYDAGIQFFDFSDIMRKAHTDEQMKKLYGEKKTGDIGYLAVGAVIPTDFDQEFLGTLTLFGSGGKKTEPAPKTNHIPTTALPSPDHLLPEHAQYGYLLESAHGLIETHAVQTKAHLIATGAAMEALAPRFGGDPATWKVAGMLHDLDWDNLGKDWEKHCGSTLEEMLKTINAPEELLGDIRAHYQSLYGEKYPLNSSLRKALYCVDELTGFIIAVTYVRPSKKIADVEVSSVTKKLKDKGFAAQVDREQIRQCETLLGIPLAEMVGIVLEAMKKEADALGL